MKVRYFIVGPTAAFPEDTLWKVCSTTKSCSFDEIYMNDWFVDEYSTDSKLDAIEYCKKRFGSKRIYIYA